jgi:phosphate-selective porin OprO/OprP
VRHNLLLTGLASSLFCLGFSTAVFAGAVTSDEQISVSTTGGGIKIKSDNGNTFEVGGRIMYDMDFFDGAYNTDFADNRAGDSASEAEFRRTRLELEGSVAGAWEYEFVVDIDEGDTSIDTGYIAYTGFSFADVILGRTKAPFGLEELTSSKWLSTIERSPITEIGFLAGKPSFQLALHGNTASSFWQAAIIDEDQEDDSGKDAYSLAGRLGGHFGVGTNSFVHLAGSYAIRDFGNLGNERFRTRLGVHTIERITVNDAERFGVDSADQYGLEAAGVFGPFSLQGEYRAAKFDKGDDVAATPGLNAAGQRVSDVDVDGYYLQASYFLTGESRGYKGEEGKFDKVKPKGPIGAWELVAKYEDGEVDADVLPSAAEFQLFTAGVNWYPNNNLKFMLNYLDGSTDNFFSGAGQSLDAIGEEDGKAISLRAQYAF